MEIIIISPTREKPEQCQQMVDSWKETTSGLSDIVLMLDQDDPKLDEYKAIKDVLFLINPKPEHCGASKLHNLGIQQFSYYKYFFGGSDDIRFRTKGWEERMIDEIGKEKEWLIPYANDGIVQDKKDLMSLPLIPMWLLKEVGYYGHPDLWHFYPDRMWYYIAEELGIRKYMSDISIEHLQEKYEKTDNKEVVNHDIAIYKKWKEEELPIIISKLVFLMPYTRYAKYAEYCNSKQK
jgi:hypothetical protein